MLTAITPTTDTAKMTETHDEHDEDAGHDEDDASILELGEESRPRRNKSNSVQRRSGQRHDRVLAEPTMPRIVPKSPSSHRLHQNPRLPFSSTVSRRMNRNSRDCPSPLSLSLATQ
jgi:hypothetical protein